MTDYTEYFDEVIKAHVAIEQWLAEERDGRELEQLLTRFSPQFSMVSPLGRVLDFAALNELFMLAGGKKLGFRIELSEFRGIALHEVARPSSYREQQTDATGCIRIAARPWCSRNRRTARCCGGICTRRLARADPGLDDNQL
jgi:hypothetical protein